jgi:hypothetical protein
MKDNQQGLCNRAVDKIAGARKVEVESWVEVKQLGRGSGAFSICAAGQNVLDSKKRRRV